LASILVLHGPNLNLLGTREPDKYGHVTLADINQQLQTQASDAGHHLQHLQSNAEYELVERIHDARTEGIHQDQLDVGIALIGHGLKGLL